MTHQPKVPRKRITPRQVRRDDTPRIRVRSKLLAQIDESKLAMAFYLIAQQLVEDRTETASPRLDTAARQHKTVGGTGRTDDRGGVV